MKLITSGEYIKEELRNEIGRLPASFIPINNKRLYEWQITLLESQPGATTISLPSCFELSSFDRHSLESRGVRIVRCPSGVSLGASILTAISDLDDSESLTILHGDTLFDTVSFPHNQSIFLVGQSGFEYDWDKISPHSEETHAGSLTGYFYFSSGKKFRGALCEANMDFVKAIDIYRKDEPVKLQSSDGWKDFGHRNSLFNNKKSFLISRYFNQIEANVHTVKKRSADHDKLQREFAWYQAIPESLKLFTPKTVGQLERLGNHSQYELELIPGFTLAEIYVFGKKDRNYWGNVLKELAKLLTIFYEQGEIYRRSQLKQSTLSKINDDLFLKKTLHRLHRINFLSESERKSYVDIAIEVAASIPPTEPRHVAFAHGDLCLSNILMNTHSDRLYLIDPKGAECVESPNLSDIRYDIAKLFHSFIGGYDHILAERYYESDVSLSFEGGDMQKMDSLCAEFVAALAPPEAKVTTKEIIAITIHLFLSMIPLHNDNTRRQKSFLKNVYRLVEMLDKTKI